MRPPSGRSRRRSTALAGRGHRRRRRRRGHGDQPAAWPPAVAEPEAADEERYTPQAPHRRRFVRPLIGLLVLLLVAGAGLGTAYAWTRTQYFVGAAGDQVAIYQGLSDGLPGHPAVRVYEVQELTGRQRPAAVLPGAGPGQHRRLQPGGGPRDRARADRDGQALRQPTGTGEPSSSPTPSPSNTGKPTGKPSPTASTTPTSTPSSSATRTQSSAGPETADHECATRADRPPPQAPRRRSWC